MTVHVPVLQREPIAEVIGERIANRLARRHKVLIQDSQEYLPHLIALATMDSLYGNEGYHTCTPPGCGAVAAQDVLVLLGPETARLDEHPPVVDRLLREHVSARIVVVVETPVPLDDARWYPFDLVLGPQDLIATEDEASVLHMLGDGNNRPLHLMLHTTGCVPELLRYGAAVHEGAYSAITMAARPWAERIYPDVVADPLLQLHVWVARLGEDTLALLASDVLGRQVGIDEIRRARRHWSVVPLPDHDPCLPDALAHALQALLIQRQDGKALETRQALISAVVTNAAIRSLEGVRLLTTLEEWEALDALISRRMFLLPVLRPSHREMYAELWPRDVPESLPHLERARRFVEGNVHDRNLPPSTPRPWREMVFLSDGLASPAPDELGARVLVVAARLRRSWADLSDPRNEFAQFMDFLAHETEQLEATGVRQRPDEAAAANWLRGSINRASWSNRPDWVWWPMHMVMALIESREGNIDAAYTWFKRIRISPALSMAIKSNLELALGHTAVAEELADQVLRIPGLPRRWRNVAVGVKLALSTDAGREAAMLLAGEDWENSLGDVAMFGDRSRELAATGLPAEMRTLPGIITEPLHGNGEKELRLTPRQVAVLKALDGGATMSEVAKSLSVGVETVRSTAKGIYRRMGVNDRQSAVDLGKARGII